MSKKENISDRDVAEAFETLFDETLIPESNEEAVDIILEAGIDLDSYDLKMDELVKKLLLRSPHNWRNVDTEELSKVTNELGRIPKYIDKSKQELMDLIGNVLKELDPHNQYAPAAYRNIDELTENDLASLLQELEYKLSVEKKQDSE